MTLRSCYDCAWECLDGCCLRLDDNGRREPVSDVPIECEDFIEKEEIKVKASITIEKP